MPSTISTSVSRLFASSTVITPSLPTFCIACAIILPMLLSPFDEMVPTCATSAEDETFLARFSMSLTTAATARSMPRLRSIGFMPAATDLAPSRSEEHTSKLQSRQYLVCRLLLEKKKKKKKKNRIKKKKKIKNTNNKNKKKKKK